MVCSCCKKTPPGQPAGKADSDRRFACLFGANTNGVVYGTDENLSVPDFSRFCGLHNRCHGLFHQTVRKHDFDLNLWQKIDGVFTAALNLGMPLLTAKALHFTHRHSLEPEARQCILHFLELEGFNDGLDLFHEFVRRGY